MSKIFANAIVNLESKLDELSKDSRELQTAVKNIVKINPVVIKALSHQTQSLSILMILPRNQRNRPRLLMIPLYLWKSL